jgi:hypothetical protein
MIITLKIFFQNDKENIVRQEKKLTQSRAGFFFERKILHPIYFSY